MGKRNLIEFTPDLMKQHRIGKEASLGVAYSPLKTLYKFYKRMIGDFTREDRIKLACDFDVPLFFMLRGCMISHPYGITLSVDEIGNDCRIGQNVTIGTSGRTMEVGGPSKGMPRIGNLVSCYPGSVISGSVSIGNHVIIAAGAFVDKDVPDNSIVYGCNRMKPLQEHHKRYLKMQLWHCIYDYELIPGLIYIHPGKLFIDEDYARQRVAFLTN